ncbi:MAG: hypothetical protein JRH07_01040 [Deltaproteobacteria bacterium]|nr:hypothetical protein [Deltaproteobacteria bacterium]
MVVAGGDSPCALLAAGGTKPGRTAVVAGTSAPVMKLIGRLEIDSDFHVTTTPHLIPETWILEGNTQRAGRTLSWYVETFLSPSGRKRRSQVYDRLEHEALKVEPGSRGLRAYLGPVVGHLDRFQGPVKSTLMGIDTMDNSRFTLYALGRAVLENIAMAIRGNLLNLERVGGGGDCPIGLTGGLTRSGLFNLILASVLNRPVRKTPFVEGSTRGVLVLCHYGLGRYSSIEEAGRNLIPSPEEILPDPDWARRYAEVFEEWTGNYRILAGLPDSWPGDTVTTQKERRMI